MGDVVPIRPPGPGTPAHAAAMVEDWLRDLVAECGGVDRPGGVTSREVASVVELLARGLR